MLRGDRLKDLRLRGGFSTERLARQLNMSKTQYQRYENEQSDATTGVLIRIARFYGVSTDYLLGLSENEHAMTENLLSMEEKTLIHWLRKKEYVQAQRVMYVMLLSSIYPDTDVPSDVYQDTHMQATRGKYDPNFDGDE